MLISFYQLLCAAVEKAVVHNKLFSLIERWKNALDQNAIFSKAFDDINHDIIIAKLGAYGFDTESLN